MKGGCKYVFEGANMPSTPAAINVLKPNAVYFPAKVETLNFRFFEPNFLIFGCREFFFSIRFFEFQSRLDPRACSQNEIKCDFLVDDH